MRKVGPRLAGSSDSRSSPVLSRPWAPEGIFPAVYSYLRMTVGQRPGASYLLNPEAENVIGRGRDCSIVLADPLCSRVHAVMVHEDAGWRIRDGQSRNGTFVNGRAVRETMLHPDDRVRIGSTEFTFRETPDPPSSTSGEARPAKANVVQQVPAGVEPGAAPVRGLPEGEAVRDLMSLHQLAVRLVSARDEEQVARACLEILQHRLAADLVALLVPDHEGTLEPRLVLPQAHEGSSWLQATLTRAVVEDGQAVWLASRGGEGSRSGGRVGDALCVPLADRQRPVAALLAVRQAPSFQQVQFDFMISAAHLTGLAWARVAADDADGPEFARSSSGESDAASPADLTDLDLGRWERRLIEQALERTGHRVPEAAKLLGISRATLYRKLAELDLK